MDGEESNEIVKLPAALEMALAFKNERAKEIGMTNELEEEEVTQVPRRPSIGIDIIEDEMIDSGIETLSATETDKSQKSSKTNKQKSKKKKKKKKRQETTKTPTETEKSDKQSAEDKQEVEVEYIQEIPGVHKYNTL